MSDTTSSCLEKENALLRVQLASLKQHLTGSLALKQPLDDIKTNDTIYCTEATLHEIATGLIEPAHTCIDIGPGLKPQRIVKASTQLLLEADAKTAEALTRFHPTKLTLNAEAATVLAIMSDNSVDTITLLHVLESMDKATGQQLVLDACRVARKQVIVLSTLDETGTPSAPGQHSNWAPADFKHHIAVIARAEAKLGGTKPGQFYAIIPCSAALTSGLWRLIILSELVPDFVYQPGDIIVADIAYAELSQTAAPLPRQNCLYAPLKLIASNNHELLEMLRNTMINFSQMEEYIHLSKRTIPLGIAAQEVIRLVQGGPCAMAS